MDAFSALLLEKSERLFLLVGKTYTQQVGRLTNISKWLEEKDKQKWEFVDIDAFEEMKMLTQFYHPKLNPFIIQASKLANSMELIHRTLLHKDPSKLPDIPEELESAIQGYSDWWHSFQSAITEEVRSGFKTL